MAIRLQQMHPALVHVPITLLPLAVGADLIGRVSGNQFLLGLGRRAIELAALGALGAPVTGLIAGEAVNAEGESRDMLMTHRNLNFVATVVATSMAVWRTGHKRPNTLYLGAGLAGVAVVAYTASLGGKLVYEGGVGVGPAKGVYRADAPKLQPGHVSAFFETAATGVASDATSTSTAPSCARRIFLATDDGRLFALDADSGTPCSGFGNGGALQLATQMGNLKPGYYMQTSPPW